MPFDLQRQALLLYKALVEEREDWGGRLVLCCGRGSALSGVPAAASIAGAATLAVDGDEAAVKLAMRRGEVDFVVNTLDEALRALKNEIRKRRPLSVGLIGDVAGVLDEMAERGVQPEMLLIPPTMSAQEVTGYPGIEVMIGRGMSCRVVQAAAVDAEPSRARSGIAGDRFSAYFFPAQDGAALRALDLALLGAIPAEDNVRRGWIERVPQYLRAGPRTGRWVWLSEEELQGLAAAGIVPLAQ